VERLLELDAMLGTLDFVARTEWVTILPAIMMADEIRTELFTVNRIVDPALMLDLILIEPSRRLMSPGARAFLTMLEEEAAGLASQWGRGNLTCARSGRRACAFRTASRRKVLGG
jgi:DNA-binding transcriptional LysR family regulator